MSKKGSEKNVGLIYRQQVLSGYERINQPTNTNGDSTQNEQGRKKELPKQFWQSKAHQVSIQLVVEKVSNGSNEHRFKIRLNDDTNVLVSSYTKQSKRVSEEFASIPGTSGRKAISLPVVYGISENGVSALSPTDGHTIPEFVASVYSFVLGQLDRTIERIILEQENKASNDDTGKRLESDKSPQVVGNNQAGRRGKKILSEVRDEAGTEVPAKMVQADG